MKLTLKTPEYYRVKRGQTLNEIAQTFLLPPRLLAAVNRLESPPEEGTVLKIPQREGNLYLVRGGESKALLCGSVSAFEEKNLTCHLYPGQIIVL